MCGFLLLGMFLCGGLEIPLYSRPFQPGVKINPLARDADRETLGRGKVFCNAKPVKY